MNPEIRKANLYKYLLLSLYMYVKYLIWWSLCRELYGIGRGEPAMPCHTHIDLKLIIQSGNCLDNPRPVLYYGWSVDVEDICELILKNRNLFCLWLNHDKKSKKLLKVRKSQQQIALFSILPKNEQKYLLFRFSTLRKWQ